MNYTSLEQSKKLIELGIDSTTANMKYKWDFNEHNFIGPTRVLIPNWNDPYNKDVPCWAAEDLLKIIPKYVSESNKTNTWQILPGYDVAFCLSYITFSGIEIVSFKSNSLIDICYDAICWVMENYTK